MIRCLVRLGVFALFLSASGTLAACSNDATPQPARPTPSAGPSATPAVAPTPTTHPAPSATPVPSATPSLSATASPTPTASPRPTATPVPTPSPSPTPALPAAPAQYLTGYYNESGGANKITQVLTTMTVPAEPPHAGTVFLWPGLDPVDGAHYEPIDNGVLQPVLTWGPSCAPGNQPATYSTWWVSAQYVNTIGHDNGYTGCQGGPIMPVNVGDSLVETMSVSGTVWNQTVMDVQTGMSVSYAIDLMMQEQQIVYFVIEGYGQAPVGAVTFSNTSFTFSSAPTEGCALSALTTTSPLDTYSTAVASNGGLTCSIANITIYAPYSTNPASMFRRGRAPFSGQVQGRR